jgi:hypothetical protein
MKLEDADGERPGRFQDDVFFLKEGDKQREVAKEMFRIYKEKSRIMVNKKVYDDSLTRSSSVS